MPRPNCDEDRSARSDRASASLRVDARDSEFGRNGLLVRNYFTVPAQAALVSYCVLEVDFDWVPRADS